jgi:hypothetical protein
MTLSVAKSILAVGALTLAPTVGHAFSTVTIEQGAYEWVEAEASPRSTQQPFTARAFGPFHVVAGDRVELRGSIDSDTPAQFRALLRAYPNIVQIDMVDCAGTDDDEANLELARMIRKAGIATYVPDGGSVRSGGVELFLAGVRRSAAPDAEFAVHSWIDEDGLEPDDYAESDPVNREYVDYYREMGMSADKAKAFYALTNSVPHDDALYLKPRDIAAFIPLHQ